MCCFFDGFASFHDKRFPCLGYFCNVSSTKHNPLKIFCIADDFCKVFDAQMAKYTFKAERKRKYHRESQLLNFMITPGDVDDRKPLEYKAFVDLIYGKLVGDKGYIGKNLFEKLFVDGIQLITKLKSNMKGALMSVSDKLLLRNRAIIRHLQDKNDTVKD